MEAAVEVDVQDGFPVFRGHFHQALVPEDPGIIDQNVQPPKGFQGGVDDVLSPGGLGHIVRVGHGLAPGGPDLVHHGLGRGGGSVTGAVPGTAQIVDHHLGTAFGQFQGIGPAQTGPGPGDHGHPALEVQIGGQVGRPGHGHGLPEIVDHAPLLVHVAPLELQAHGQAHPQILLGAVGEIGNETAAPLELDHPVEGRGIHGDGEHVRSKSLNPGRDVGEFIILLAAHGPALRIDADVHFGELGGSAVPAFSPHQSQDHLILPVEDGHGRLGGGFGPDAHFRLHELPETQIFIVIVQALFVFQMAGETLAGGQVEDLVRDPEIEGVGPLAVAGHQNPLPGLGRFQGLGQHEEGMGRARLPADAVEVVHQLLLARPQLGRNLDVVAFEEAGVDQGVHIRHGDLQLVHQAGDHPGNEFAVALVPLPAFLPIIVEFIEGAPVMVHEIRGDGMGAQAFGNDPVPAHGQGAGPVAEPHFVKIGRPALPFVRGRHQNGVPLPAFHRLQGRDQGGGGGLLGGGEIRLDHFGLQVQGRGHHPRILPVAEGQSGGGEIEGVQSLLVPAGEAVPGRGHGHGQTVLVPIAQGALPLGHGHDGRGEPGHGLNNGRPAQSQFRNICAICGNTNHGSSLAIAGLRWPEHPPPCR